MTAAACRFLGIALGLEAVYLASLMAVVLPFAATMDSFDDGDRNVGAYAVLGLVLTIAAMVLAMAALGMWRSWVERPNRAWLTRNAVGGAAVLNLAGAVVAVVTAVGGEPLFFSLAAVYGLLTGLACLRHRARTQAPGLPA